MESAVSLQRLITDEVPSGWEGLHRGIREIKKIYIFIQSAAFIIPRNVGGKFTKFTLFHHGMRQKSARIFLYIFSYSCGPGQPTIVILSPKQINKLNNRGVTGPLRGKMWGLPLRDNLKFSFVSPIK